MKRLLGWKVQGHNGQILEDRMDDPEEVTCTLDAFLEELRRQWGANTDVFFHVWRENWSA
jgi:hypothetical protein